MSSVVATVTNKPVIDALVLAESVRISLGRLKPWRPPSEIILQLCELLRWREEPVQQRTAACQRLRALLAEWPPHFAGLCDTLDCVRRQVKSCALQLIRAVTILAYLDTP